MCKDVLDKLKTVIFKGDIVATSVLSFKSVRLQAGVVTDIDEDREMVAITYTNRRWSGSKPYTRTIWRQGNEVVVTLASINGVA